MAGMRDLERAEDFLDKNYLGRGDYDDAYDAYTLADEFVAVRNEERERWERSVREVCEDQEHRPIFGWLDARDEILRRAAGEEGSRG